MNKEIKIGDYKLEINTTTTIPLDVSDNEIFFCSSTIKPRDFNEDRILQYEKTHYLFKVLLDNNEFRFVQDNGNAYIAVIKNIPEQDAFIQASYLLEDWNNIIKGDIFQVDVFKLDKYYRVDANEFNNRHNVSVYKYIEDWIEYESHVLIGKSELNYFLVNNYGYTGEL